MSRVVILLVVLCQSVFGYASYSGWCEQGGVKVTVQGLNSPLTFQQSFPNALQSAAGPNVTVYATGTTDKATIYSDNTGTVLANPFPCTSTGQYQFFAANSVVDLLFSGTGISSFTRSAITVTDGCPTNSACDAGYATLAAACAAAGTGTLYLTRTWSGLTTQTFACNIEALANGIIKPASGQTITLSKSISGSLTQHFDTSAGGIISITGTVESIPVQWFGATCNGADENTAIQSALSTGLKVTLPANSTCGTSVSLTTGASGQIISGTSLSGLSSGGKAILKATASIAGPVLALINNAVQVRDVVIDGNSGNATYGITAECANKGLISSIEVRGTQSDALRITNTDAAYTGCADGPNNNNLIVENSIFTGSRAGRGIHITGLSGDVNNNLIQFNGLRVSGNFQDGICGHGSQNQINGGDWSSNGSNTGSTQYYGIKLTQCGETSEVQGAQNWMVVQPDPEASNFNTSTSLYRGPQIYFGNLSQQNTLIVSGNVGDVCNDPGCSYYSAGSDNFVLTNIGGGTKVIGTGTAASSSECIYDHYSSVLIPKWCIQGSGSGGEVLTVAIASGGTGWKPGDRATITQGGSSGSALVRVTAVSGSTATSVSLLGGQQGYGYSTASGLATSAFGGSSGSGLTLNITAGYTGGYRPIAAALVNSNGGIVITDTNGELSQKLNTVVTVGANNGSNTPVGTQHVTVDATSASVGLFLPSSPTIGETHTITMTATAAGHFVTIVAQGTSPANNINLSSGGTTTLTAALNRAGDSMTLRYNGVTGWDILPGNGTMPGLTSSAGSGGLYVCVDSNGNLYKKSSCP